MIRSLLAFKRFFHRPPVLAAPLPEKKLVSVAYFKPTDLTMIPLNPAANE